MSDVQHNGNSLRTWIHIDKRSVQHNYKLFRTAVSSPTRICGVVKSNAYGHCLIDFATQLEELGIDWFAVDTLVEGIALRDSGITKPILVLGYTLPDMYGKAAYYDISITVSGHSALQHVLQYTGPNRLKIHIKADTGMHRQGFFEHEFDELLHTLVQEESESMLIEGLYTHFSDAKNPSEPQRTHDQLVRFNRIRDKVQGQGYDPIVHASATSSTLLFPESHFDMVRIGIGLYGLWPSEQTKRFAQDHVPLQPVLSWKTIVSDIKHVPSGACFGYGLTESVARDSVVAIIPIGYWHGYDRSLSSIGQVLIRGSRAKVLGTVSMDIIVVDVTNIDNISSGDEVTLIGTDGNEEVTADELAGCVGTINYEIVTRINPLIKRLYI